MKLSPRIQQVCELTLQGLTNKEIAHQLSLSENTVRLYKKRLYAYLGVHSKQELRNKIMGEPVRIEAPSRMDLYVSYRRQGLTYKEIGRLESVSHQHVKTYVSRCKAQLV